MTQQVRELEAALAAALARVDLVALESDELRAAASRCRSREEDLGRQLAAARGECELYKGEMNVSP